MLLKSLKRFTGPLFLLLGLFFLIALIRKFGAMELWQMMGNLGLNVIYILALPVVWYASHTMAWYLIIEETGQHHSFWSLFKIKLAGEAVNTLTPMSWMGGDPVRIYMMQKRMPATLSAASVVLDRTMQSLAVLLLLVCGLISAAATINLPDEWKYLFPILTLALFAGVGFFIHRQTSGIFSFLSKVLSKVGIKKHLADNWQHKVSELDIRIAQFYKRDRLRFILVLFFHFLSRLLGVLEIYLIAFILGIPLNLVQSLLLASLSVLVNMVFVFVPGSMGVMEGAYGALLTIFGLNPINGVAIQLVRRLRTVFWILIGLSLMLHYHRGIRAAISES